MNAEHVTDEKVGEENLGPGSDTSPVAAMGTSETDSAGIEHDPNRAHKSLNPLQVVSSVFAAGLGVQSSKNRERDFQQGRAGTFIFAGLLFTALFIGTVYTIVTMVLSTR